MLKELEPTIANQMTTVRDNLSKHKKRKKIKTSLTNMQSKVDTILLKAASIGSQYYHNVVCNCCGHPVNGLQENREIDSEKIINALRRGWPSDQEIESKDNPNEDSSPSISNGDGMTRINNNSPEINE